jgi:hypothetical protein
MPKNMTLSDKTGLLGAKIMVGELPKYDFNLDCERLLRSILSGPPKRMEIPPVENYWPIQLEIYG